MTITPRQFEVHPSSGVPIYLQIADQVQALAAGGHVLPDEMLPSVRQMASELGVNPMTISKAYSKLEAEGVVERVRGKGMRIKESSQEGTIKERQAMLHEHAEQVVIRGRQLGLNDKQILAVIQTILNEVKK